MTITVRLYEDPRTCGRVNMGPTANSLDYDVQSRGWRYCAGDEIAIDGMTCIITRVYDQILTGDTWGNYRLADCRCVRGFARGRSRRRPG